MTDFVSGKAVCIGTKPKQLLLEKGLTKTLRIMKLTAILLFAAAMHVSAKGVSQDKISLSLKNAPLEKAFGEIEVQSGFVFIYKDETVKDKRISIQVSNVTLSQALDECLKGQALSYQIVGKSVAIKAIRKDTDKTGGEPMVAPPFIDVRGRVVNEKGEPVEGVTVTVKGNSKKTLTDKNGEFSLATVEQDATLVFTHITMESFEVRVSGKSELVINLRTKVSALGDVVVTVSTGYQDIPKERATGSFVKIDNELINRRIGTNVLDRLDGITSGVFFKDNRNSIPNSLMTTSVTRSSSGIVVRGETSLASSAQVSRDPLIVLDNFPYEGNLSNINPNDIESVTILKDAAAASIWGARAGNGVIVITTKRGKLNQKLKVDFNSNLTITGKPNLKKDPSYLSSSDYIDLEKQLFDLNYYNSDLINTTSRPVLTPVVEILAKQRAGTLSVADANSQIDALRNRDLRDDFERYIYQKGIKHQYSLGFSGGSNNLAYQLSFGYDKNEDNLVRNNFSRFTVNSNNNYRVSKRLELSTSINFSQNTTDVNNNFPYNTIAVGNKTSKLYPYAKLADENGTPLSIPKDFRSGYIDSVQKLGFLDWRYSPIDEINNSDQTAKVNDLLLRVSLQYKIFSGLSLNVDYQNESQRINNRIYNSQDLYSTRNLINRYTQYNASTKSFTYPIPKGGVLQRGNYIWNNNSLRTKLAYNSTFNGIHTISSIAGIEIRELKNSGSNNQVYGYDNSLGTVVSQINYNTQYTTNPNSSSFIPTISGGESELLTRYISFYANASYGYWDKYIFSLSGRKDGSNMLGVSTNNRITPLWSTGFKWVINKENFYNFSMFPSLALRLTYGYSGNIYNGSAYPIGSYSTNPFGVQALLNLSAPNPSLKWEKIRTINLGIDFTSKNNFLDGSIELYQKDGRDLIQSISTPGSTGFTSFTGNAASTRVKGVELTLSGNLKVSQFKWQPTLLVNYLNDKVKRYTVPVTASSFRQISGGPIEGYAVYSLFSYKWAGLDPTNGDPLGFEGKTESNNYNSLINSLKPDSLVYHGSALPRVFGSIRNDFSYKSITLSVNIIYKFDYYFRRSSTSLNLTDVVSNKMHQDFTRRWQAPGDELTTEIPSVVFNGNSNRNTFYQYSEALVERGDHIRLSDIRLTYDLPNNWVRKAGILGLRAYSYLSNVGIIWKKNSKGIDPDTYSYDGIDRVSIPLSISFGVQATF